MVVPDLSSPPSAPHPLVQSAFAVAEEGGGCRLSLLEAFFLVHAFDALAVHCDGARMSAAALLSHAHSTELRFVQSFCAFAYWTALGWVVRRGSKLGVDFLLYPYRALSARTGRTHSTFSVLVLDDAAAAEGRAMSGPAQLEALLRVQHSTRKVSATGWPPLPVLAPTRSPWIARVLCGCSSGCWSVVLPRRRALRSSTARRRCGTL